MHVVPIDPKESGAILAPCDLVRRPEFVDEGLSFAHVRTIYLRTVALWGLYPILYAKEYQVKRPPPAAVSAGRTVCATGSARQRRSRSISFCATASSAARSASGPSCPPKTTSPDTMAYRESPCAARSANWRGS